jgi:RHS repeat-associated protein
MGPGTDQLLARSRPADGVTWYVTDRLASVRDLVGAGGTLVDHVDYDSFGNILTETNPGAGDRFKFTGQAYEATTGLYYYRARYYDPALGRFINQDPIGFDGGDTNLYRYVGNDPVNKTDPTGQAAATASYGTTFIVAFIFVETIALAKGFADFQASNARGYFSTNAGGNLDATVGLSFGIPTLNLQHFVDYVQGAPGVVTTTIQGSIGNLGSYFLQKTSTKAPATQSKDYKKTYREKFQKNRNDRGNNWPGIPPGQVGTPTQTHHSVPKGDKRADAIRNLISQCIDINDVANLIELITGPGATLMPGTPSTMTPHNETFRESYFDELNRLFGNLDPNDPNLCDKILDLLDDLRCRLTGQKGPKLNLPKK